MLAQPVHASVIPPNTSVNGSEMLSLLYTSKTGGLNNTTYGNSSYSIFSIAFDAATASERVFAACTHGLFIEDAANRLRVCDDILSSDTLEGVYTRFSVAPAIADAL